MDKVIAYRSVSTKVKKEDDWHQKKSTDNYIHNIRAYYTFLYSPLYLLQDELHYKRPGDIR